MYDKDEKKNRISSKKDTSTFFFLSQNILSVTFVSSNRLK